MPFITEEIWQALPHQGDSLTVAPWPQEEGDGYPQEEADFEKIMDVIKAIRNRRGEMNVPPSKKAGVYIATEHQEVFRQGVPFITRLAFASHVEVGESFQIEGAVQVVTDAARVFIPMAELVDREKELARLAKEKAVCEKDIAMLTGKLSNEGFVAKAPANVVEAERAKLEKRREHLAKIQESIQAFQ